MLTVYTERCKKYHYCLSLSFVSHNDHKTVGLCSLFIFHTVEKKLTLGSYSFALVSGINSD